MNSRTIVMVSQERGKLNNAPSRVSATDSLNASLLIFIIGSFIKPLYTFMLSLTLTWKNEYRICVTELYLPREQAPQIFGGRVL